MLLTAPTNRDCLLLPKTDYDHSFSKKLVHQVVADDESTEASIRQRVRNIESNLFDEYWSELLAYKQELSPIGNTHESSRYYDHQSCHYR